MGDDAGKDPFVGEGKRPGMVGMHDWDLPDFGLLLNEEGGSTREGGGELAADDLAASPATESGKCSCHQSRSDEPTKNGGPRSSATH